MRGASAVHIALTCLLVITLSGCKSYEERLIEQYQKQNQERAVQQDRYLDAQAVAIGRAAWEELQAEQGLCRTLGNRHRQPNGDILNWCETLNQFMGRTLNGTACSTPQNLGYPVQLEIFGSKAGEYYGIFRISQTQGPSNPPIEGSVLVSISPTTGFMHVRPADGRRNLRIIPAHLRMSLVRDEAGQGIRGTLVAFPGNEVPIPSEQCEVHFSHPDLKMDKFSPVSSEHILAALSAEGEITRIAEKEIPYWLQRAAADSQISRQAQQEIADRAFVLAEKENSDSLYRLALEQYLLVAKSSAKSDVYGRIGSMYASGHSTRADQDKAKKWLDLSAAMKDEEANVIAGLKAVCLHEKAGLLIAKRLNSHARKLTPGQVVDGTNFRLMKISWSKIKTNGDDKIYCNYSFYKQSPKPDSNPVDVEENASTPCDSRLLFQCTNREKELEQDLFLFNAMASGFKSMASNRDIEAPTRGESLLVTPVGSNRFKLANGTAEEITVDISSGEK